MPKIVDANLQAKLLEDAKNLYEKRAQLEASIRAADALSKHRIDTAALREIHAFRTRQGAAAVTPLEHSLPAQRPEMPSRNER